MALQQETLLPTGITASYWRIDMIDYNIGLVFLNLYYDSSKEPLYNLQLEVDIDKKNDNLGTIYDKIKQLAQFINAINC